jgi:hypothetical protein
VPPDRDVVVMDNVVATTEVAIVICRLDVAVCAVDVVESVTVIAAEAVPTELCAGVPEIAPVELLIDKPLGRPLALNL